MNSVCARPPCDGQQPPKRVGIGAERLETAKRTEIGVLYEVVEMVAIAQVAAVAGDVVDGESNEPVERSGIAVLRVEEDVSGVRPGVGGHGVGGHGVAANGVGARGRDGSDPIGRFLCVGWNFMAR